MMSGVNEIGVIASVATARVVEIYSLDVVIEVKRGMTSQKSQDSLNKKDRSNQYREDKIRVLEDH